MGGGPKGSSTPSFGGGSCFLRRLLPSPHRFQLIMDDTIARMPDAPDPHVTVTVRTAQGVSPGALLIALAVGHRGDDFDRALDDTCDLGQGLLKHVLD
jgi:hypothetical protein